MKASWYSLVSVRRDAFPQANQVHLYMHGAWFVELYWIYTVIYREHTMLLVFYHHLVFGQQTENESDLVIKWAQEAHVALWDFHLCGSVTIIPQTALFDLHFIFDLGFIKNQFSIAFIGNMKDILKYWNPLTQPNKNNSKLITFLCQLKHIKLHGRNSCSQRNVSGPLP